MAINLKQYNKWKKRVEELQTEADKAEGKLEQLMTELKDDFECEDLEEAEDLLEGLRKDEVKAQHAYEKESAKFEKEWEEVLNE